MAFIKNNLISILIIAACAAALIVYENYFAPTPSDVLAPVAATSTEAGANLLSSIEQLKAVNFDSSLFSDPVFASLIDFGVVIPPEPVGRANPFAPLGGVSAPSTNIAPATISTTPAKTKKK